MASSTVSNGMSLSRSMARSAAMSTFTPILRGGSDPASCKQLRRSASGAGRNSTSTAACSTSA